MKTLAILSPLFVCSFYGIAQSTIDLKVGGNYTFIETQPILMESSSNTLNIYSKLKKYKNSKLEVSTNTFETNTFEAGHTVRILNIESEKEDTLEEVRSLTQLVIKNHIILKDKTKVYINYFMYIKA